MRLALILALMCGAPAAAQEPTPAYWTAEQVRTMTPEAMTRRLFGDLSQTILPLTTLNELSAWPNRRLGELTFMTVPRATYEPGLCESDYVWVSFEPVTRPAPADDGDIPVKPRTVRTGTFFIVRDGARFLRGGFLLPADRASAQEGCASIDPRTAQHIDADDSMELRRGLNDMVRLISLAKTGKVNAVLDCEGMARDKAELATESVCLRGIAALDIAEIGGIADCEHSDEFSACRRIDFEEGQVIMLAFRRGETAPARVTLFQIPQPSIID